MKTEMNNTENLGWNISNGSGWNNHETATALDALLASSPNELPSVPLGYAVLVAPVNPEKPLGLRCALVKVLPRVIEDGLDDGCDGDPDSWAKEAFSLDVERIYSCTCEQQNEDNSDYFIRKMREQLGKIEVSK